MVPLSGEVTGTAWTSEGGVGTGEGRGGGRREMEGMGMYEREVSEEGEMLTRY